MEKLEGSILGTVFRNDENGYTVLSVRSGRSEFTVVGTLPQLAQGENAIFTGEWTEHKAYGRQFKCVSCELETPSTASAIERYLASGIISGVGPSTARQIVGHFGDKTMEILSAHPERLQEIYGIGAKRAAMIAESFKENQATRRAMVFLQSYGLPPTLSVKIAQKYGDRTPDLLKQNPYRLCEDIEGVGFQTADRIGAALGIPPDSEFRIRSALKYALMESSYSSGHVYLPEPDLLSAAAGLLRISRDCCVRELKAMLLRRELTAALEEGDETRHIYTNVFYEAEMEVAGRIRELMAAISPGRFSGAKKAVAAFEQAKGISFSPRQRDAIIRALETGVFVITGGPGTGKTTIINCILDLLSRENTILLCAPTGRAAKRMTEATGAESRTIHRMLEYSGEEGRFSRDEEEPLDADCIIVDEASMIDLPLMQALLRAVEPGSRLILVGDADQLPSVGPGNILGDILSSGVVPCARLTDIYRQSETSRIALNAHLINQGEMPRLNGPESDFFFERKPLPREAADTIVALASQRLPVYMKYCSAQALRDPARRRRALAKASRNIQVLAPAKKGECGVNNLNVLLQNALNPTRDGVPELKWGETFFRVGDKVIQTRNNYDLVWTQRTKEGLHEGEGVFNGDIGFITEVSPDGSSLTVLFDEDREAIYEGEDLADLSLAYCLSVHKSQGSEFPVVILPVVSGPPMLLTRNLFYTAMTRARNLVVLVGTEEIIRTMVNNDHVARRYTTLTRRLQEWQPDW